MQIQQAINTACSSLGLDRREAQLLLLHALDKPLIDRAWLIAHDTDSLAGTAELRYIELARRRASGTPLPYLTGKIEFHGMPLQVDGRVLIPRPDTETLVDWALECLTDIGQAEDPPPQIIDLGTGSGAVALAMARFLAQTGRTGEVHALDVSPDALALAQANAERLDLRVQFMLGAWLTGISARYDLIVSNPPYIAEGDPHLAALGHEPRLALISGPDGLDAIRIIVRQAPDNLRPGGWLLLEHGWDQALAVRELLTRAGFADVQSRRDLAGIERCSGGRWPG
ncbi:peptide chain release factor N(5)-glutamine methyltransferase [Hylemonella gracilis]|uniref:Release factor glutamine methyltransferase n=1 Tax=Hylemonella gracilis ATCC 19624 TaxID=887062 RepID=F3KTE5_9BURK|nr:peptide chain release factor N(5)-glutamine methyltransferase [Hylemonella gracilis]EGI76824.1 N5-glutamine S-adenosyl-L-methionine-dependent methyltransferase [Hylemonella gracilis ATCC 19624]